MENNDTIQNTESVGTEEAQSTLANIELKYFSEFANLNTEHLARTTALDGKNFIIIDAMLTDSNGNNDNTSPMTVTATDESQNTVIDGTGSNINGKYYYEYRYFFKTTGDHTITFAADGVTQSVTISVNSEDTRTVSDQPGF